MIDRNQTDYEIQRAIEIQFCKNHIKNARKHELSVVVRYFKGILDVIDEPEDEESEEDAAFYSVHQIIKDSWR